MKPKWVKLGVVGVDSGRLMIADPTYVEGKDWDKKDHKKWISDKLYDRSVNVPFENGVMGKALLFSSGLGDGVYDVMGKIINEPLFGERIAEVRIILIDDKHKKMFKKLVTGQR
jgi:hypothetical protein